MKRWRLLEKKRKQQELPNAMRVLCKHLKDDSDYYYGWQSNIAMAFINNDREINSYEELHKQANDSAKQFLNTLIK